MWGQFCMFLFLETLNTCWHIQTVLEFWVKSEWFHQLYQLLNVRIVLKYLEQSRFEENLHPGWQINFLTSHSLQLLWSNELIALRFIGAYTVGWNHLLMHGAEYWSTHLATKRYWCVMLEVEAFSTCEMQMWPRAGSAMAGMWNELHQWPWNGPTLWPAAAAATTVFLSVTFGL